MPPWPSRGSAARPSCGAASATTHAGATIRAGLKAEQVDVRYVQAFEGARSSTSAIIVDDKGERLIVGQRDAGMPSDTSWLPLERVKEADAVLGDLQMARGRARRIRAARARTSVPTVLDADLGAREALVGPAEAHRLRDLLRAGAARVRRGRDGRGAAAIIVLSLGPKHAGVTLGSEGYAWRERGGGGHVPAFSVSVTDTTGAGDAFHGAFALMLAEGTCAGRERARSQPPRRRSSARGSARARACRRAPSWRRSQRARADARA